MCSYRSCTIHRNAVCGVMSVSVYVCVSVCQSIGVEKKKKNFPIGHVRETVSASARSLPRRSVKSSPLTKAEGKVGGRKRSPVVRHAPTTNRSSGSIRNDYRWLRERGVCTRPALGIYIETNPISHYVRSFKFTSKFSVYACDIKVYLHTT